MVHPAIRRRWRFWSLAARCDHPDQRFAALTARARIAQRAGWLVSNAPIAELIANCWAVNLVSDGPSTRSGHPNAGMRRALEAAWICFFAACDIDGGDLCSVLNRIVRGMVGDGETFIRFVTSPRGELRLQILVPDQIASDRDNGVNIIGGIELRRGGRARGLLGAPLCQSACERDERSGTRPGVRDLPLL